MRPDLITHTQVQGRPATVALHARKPGGLRMCSCTGGYEQLRRCKALSQQAGTAASCGHLLLTEFVLDVEARKRVICLHTAQGAAWATGERACCGEARSVQAVHEGCSCSATRPPYSRAPADGLTRPCCVLQMSDDPAAALALGISHERGL